MQKGDLQWDPLPLDCQQLVPETDAQDLCTVSMEKRIREQETWRLQKTLQDVLFRFQDWLWNAETMAISPNSLQVSYASSKKELQKFEALQRQVSDKLLPLEALNRQYHQLVRRGSICPQLKSRVQEVNQRWDALKAQAAAVYKRLKYFVSQWEEFESERETLQLWLMELDLRLTDVEHFSGGTSLEKMIQLQAFQEDVQANAERVDHLLVHGERLIQKSHPEDAEILEEELRDLSCFCQEVFRRVFRFRRRLVSMRLVFEDEWVSDRDSDLESDCFSVDSLQLDNGEAGQPHSPLDPLSQSTPKKVLLQHHKRAAPNIARTMDLEWDPSVDVGGSTSHDEEDSSYYSAITGKAFSWEELVGPKQPQNQTLKKRSCGHPVEPMGFDPKRIESWLGQSCQEKRRIQVDTVEQDAGICMPIPPPAMGQFPVPSPTTRHRTKQQKPQQRTKKKAKPLLISPPGLISKEKQLDSQPAEIAITTKKGCDPPSQPWLNIPIQSQQLPKILLIWNRLMIFFFLTFLLVFFFWAKPSSLSLSEPTCLQANGYAKSFHLMLKYNGPPPT
ncbi:nesprin-2-like isoform X3 [Sceloporus undulatus]|uniref:nesprin-2-like isoform X3 n=1 Tax=Sceloporus undulatus TaxID=8520 RepID=UPI001C4B6888|nr:nesprin-2-like isoform X3 [Sceloporus undulatus]